MKECNRENISDSSLDQPDACFVSHFLILGCKWPYLDPIGYES